MKIDTLTRSEPSGAGRSSRWPICGSARCARLARPLHQGNHSPPVGSGSLRQHRCVRRPRLPPGVAHLRARARQGICGVRHGADLGLRAQQPRAPRSVDGGRARVSAPRRSADRLRSRGAGGWVAARLAHASRFRPCGPDASSSFCSCRCRRSSVCRLRTSPSPCRRAAPIAPTSRPT